MYTPVTSKLLKVLMFESCIVVGQYFDIGDLLESSRSVKIVKEMNSDARFPCWQLVRSFSLAASIQRFCLFHSPRQYIGSVFFTCCINTHKKLTPSGKILSV